MRNNQMRFRALSGVIAGVLLFLGTAFAASPDFSRTQEEWASLRDNKLEYGELADLVHEYNPTVQQNHYDYIRFRKDYGTVRNDVSASYRRLAAELREDINYPDPGDSNYASGMETALAAENKAKELDKTADDNLEDADTLYLTYESAEAALVQTAQSNMIAYKNGLLDIQSSELEKKSAEINSEAAQQKLAAGRGTQAEVLTAGQDELTAEQNLISTRTSTDTVKRKLQIMLGWSGSADPEIGDIPEPDTEAADAVNPEGDLDKAIENNYTLKSEQKKLANAVSDTQKDTLNSEIAENRNKIAAGLQSAAANIRTASENFKFTNAEADLKKQMLDQTARKFEQGRASRLEYDLAEVASEQADVACCKAQYNLRESQEAYQWIVKGLLPAS